MRCSSALAFAISVIAGSHAMGQVPGAGGLTPDVPGTTFSLPLFGGKANANLTVTAGQGFSRSMTTNAALATVPNAMPGFVFGGTIQPFVTGLVPVVASGNYRIQPVALSPVGRMLLQGDLQVRKDTNKGPNLIISESLKRRADEPPPAPPEPGNAFRRGIEKYASPKR